MTTTYLRAFTALDLKAAIQALDGRVAPAGGDRPCPFNEARNAMQVPANGEAIAMPIVATGWFKRARDLQLPKKGTKRAADQEAYMQGAMAAMVALGVMTVERANQIGFMCMVGRLDKYVADQAALDDPLVDVCTEHGIDATRLGR